MTVATAAATAWMNQLVLLNGVVITAFTTPVSKPATTRAPKACHQWPPTSSQDRPMAWVPRRPSTTEWTEALVDLAGGADMLIAEGYTSAPTIRLLDLADEGRFLLTSHVWRLDKRDESRERRGPGATPASARSGSTWTW